MGMLGSSSRPTFTAKGAETHGLLLFVVVVLERYAQEFSAEPAPAPLQARLFLAAGHAALDFDKVMNTGDRNFPPDVRLIFFQRYMKFSCLLDRAVLPVIPKVHLGFHMVHKAGERGHPRLQSTYKFESTNGVLARIARSCHRANWAMQMHSKCAIMQQLQITTQMP